VGALREEVIFLMWAIVHTWDIVHARAIVHTRDIVHTWGIVYAWAIVHIWVLIVYYRAGLVFWTNGLEWAYVGSPGLRLTHH
jgi:hypothetical protein